jgi:hypothetical protein
MHGFEVVSINDDKCIGHVVGQIGDNLVVEHGHLRHHRNVLPLSFAEVDEANQRVTTTLSAHMVHESPDVKDEEVDQGAVAAYYGINDGTAEGYGDTQPGEVTAGVESDMDRSPSGAEERATVQDGYQRGQTPDDHAGAPAADSPALLGDRRS